MPAHVHHFQRGYSSQSLCVDCGAPEFGPQFPTEQAKALATDVVRVRSQRSKWVPDRLIDRNVCTLYGIATRWDSYDEALADVSSIGKWCETIDGVLQKL